MKPTLPPWRLAVRMKVRLARARSLPRTITVRTCGTLMATSCTL